LELIYSKTADFYHSMVKTADFYPIQVKTADFYQNSWFLSQYG